MGVAAQRFVSHDGWAIASHIALSSLTSLFPFLILLAALAGLFGTQSLADEAGVLIFDAWPREIAKPIVGEVHRVLTEQRSGVLTLGALFALYFSSSGVESLRVGLNRAYGLRESRPWWLTRLESIGYVICGAFAMLAFALLVVLGPLIWRNVVLVAPGLEPLSLDGGDRPDRRHGPAARGRAGHRPQVRRGRAALDPVGAAGDRGDAGPVVLRRPRLRLLPRPVLQRLRVDLRGLATAMVFLVFLYWLAAMFLFGGEINGTVIAARRSRLQAKMLARRAEMEGRRAGTGASGSGA